MHSTMWAGSRIRLLFRFIKDARKLAKFCPHSCRGALSVLAMTVRSTNVNIHVERRRQMVEQRGLSCVDALFMSKVITDAAGYDFFTRSSQCADKVGVHPNIGR